jgi:hypothetical protein
MGGKGQRVGAAGGVVAEAKDGGGQGGGETRGAGIGFLASNKMVMSLLALRFRPETRTPAYYTSAYVSIRQHTSAYVSIRQHTSAYVSIRQHTSAYVSLLALRFGPEAHTPACVHWFSQQH